MSEQIEHPIVFRMGKRLYLRPMAKLDLPSMTRFINDPEVTRYLTVTHPISVEGEERWFESLASRKDDIILSVVLSNGDVFIGTTGLHKIDSTSRTATSGTALGSKKHWGKGFGTEAKMVLLDYAFNTLNLRKINSHVFANNPRSRKHLERCGYKIEGCRRAQVYRNGEYLDVYQLGVFKEDFLPLWEEFKSKK